MTVILRSAYITEFLLKKPGFKKRNETKKTQKRNEKKIKGKETKRLGLLNGVTPL
jgi:hypothetical protein